MSWVELNTPYATWHVRVTTADKRIVLQISSGDAFLTRSFEPSEINKLIDALTAATKELVDVHPS